MTHEIQSLDEDRRLLKQYRDSDTVVDPRAGAGAQVERARSTTTPPSLHAWTFPCLEYTPTQAVHVVGGLRGYTSLLAKIHNDCT